MKFPAPTGADPQRLLAWAQVLHRTLEKEFDTADPAPSLATVAVSAKTAPPSCYVPLQFPGTPLTFVTLAGGQLVLVGFDAP